MNDEVRCASCDIELGSDPLTVDGISFCCEGCALGGPCRCTYERSTHRYPRNGHSGRQAVLDLFADGTG